MVKLHTSLSGTWPKTSRPRNPWGPPGFWRVGKRMTFMSFFFYGGGWKVNALFGPSFWDFLGAEKGSGYVIICFLTEQFLHLGGEMVNSILSRPTYASVFEIGWRLGPWFIYHQWKGANDRLCVALTVENLGWNKIACHPDFWTGSVKQIITKKTGDFDSQDLHMGLSASMVPPNPMVDQQFPA